MQPELRRRFCALCTDYITGAPRQQPLGRNNAMVDVCATCDQAKPTMRLGPERGYEIREGASLKSIRVAADRVHKDTDYRTFDRHESMRARTSGWLIVRVNRRDGNLQARDRAKALETLERQPWYRELRFLGMSKTSVLFERPDPRVAEESRKPSFNPIAWLEMQNEAAK